MLDILKDLSEPSKRLILGHLKSGPKNVSELVDFTGMRQPNVSNHLARMRARKIVRSSKVGRQIYYSLASAEVAEAVAGILSPEFDNSGPALVLNSETVRLFSRAAVAGDEVACNKMVDTLMGQQEPIVEIYQELFAESLALIGRWWEVQAIDVGQEHLASAITERLMARILHYAAPAKVRSWRAVLGCTPHNWHTMGIRMISDVLRLSGWHSLFLGANVPIDSFINSVVEHQPHLVLISCPRSENEADALELITKINQLKSDKSIFLVGVGGARVNEVPDVFLGAGADFTAKTLREFSTEVVPRVIGQLGLTS